MNITIRLKKVVILMAKEKRIIMIVGIILFVIGLTMIINFSYMTYVNWVYTGLMHLFDIILGVFVFVIGLVFLMLSRKKILAATAKKIAMTIVEIILLVSGLTMIIYSGYGLYLYISGTYWFLFVGSLLIGVLLFVIGLALLIHSRKKIEHKREISN